MPYNPGITYDGDRYLAQGITSAADSIADTIKKYGEENELVKSYRSVAKNTPGFYDNMGISKEEFGGMGNKDVSSLFKAYAIKTAMQDQQQQRQFAINAEARSVAATQLAATQEERLKKASDGLTAYNEAKAAQDIAEAKRNDALVASANLAERNQTDFNEGISNWRFLNPDATGIEAANAAIDIGHQNNLSPANLERLYNYSSALQKSEVQFKMIDNEMHFFNGSTWEPVNRNKMTEIYNNEGETIGYRVGRNFVRALKEEPVKPLSQLEKIQALVSGKKDVPKGAGNTKTNSYPKVPKGQPQKIHVNEDGSTLIQDYPQN